MAKHTLENGVLPDSGRPSQKPVSSGHYRIVNGVEQPVSQPPVVITEKKVKISSGIMPAVLDPALSGKRSKTILGLTAVTMPELPAVVVDKAPVSQEIAPPPDTLKSPMRFSKPPAERKKTVMGLDINAELASLQETRAEETQRLKALEDFLGEIDAEPFTLKPSSSEVEWFVKAAFGALGFKGKLVSVISVGKVHQAVTESLPKGFRPSVLSAVRTCANDIVTSVSDITWIESRHTKGASSAVLTRIERIADRIAATLPEEVTSLIDPALVSRAYEAATLYRAADILEGKSGQNIGGFFSLFTQGWIPVGVMNNGDFLVITK